MTNRKLAELKRDVELTLDEILTKGTEDQLMELGFWLERQSAAFLDEYNKVAEGDFHDAVKRHDKKHKVQLAA